MNLNQIRAINIKYKKILYHIYNVYKTQVAQG